MANFPAQLTFELPPNSSVPDDQIFVTIVGLDPDDTTKFGYLDFDSSTLQANYTTANFSLDAATMVKSLAEIKTLNGGYTIPVPPIASGRVYFAFKDNFDQMGGFSSSGPTFGKSNPVLYDKIELHTADNPNLNATSVDFYGVSYTVTATDTNSNQSRSIGFGPPRSTILAAFDAIMFAPDNQQNGNTDIFKRNYSGKMC